jgi:protein phosphatase
MVTNLAPSPPTRYLWAVGTLAAQIPIGHLVANRYRVVAPQVWLDTAPQTPPTRSNQLSPESYQQIVLPYLYLYPYRLHLPQPFGFCHWAESPAGRGAARYAPTEILLLENAPIDGNGKLYPSIEEVWSEASALRQLNWLWQMLGLWLPLREFRLASSLLKPENIRIWGSRVWLLELLKSKTETQSDRPLALTDLSYPWQQWAKTSQASIRVPLQEICQAMRRPDADPDAIATQLNQLLQEKAQEQPIQQHWLGATDTGKNCHHNEDACYPTTADLQTMKALYDGGEQLAFGFVCDGVGGHEGGEVASRLAKQALRLEIPAFLQQVAKEESMTPQQIGEQLAAILRVVNNLIAAENDKQERTNRKRMGTTLAMAFSLSPSAYVRTGEPGVACQSYREVYLVHVGDSRAYWLTKDACHLLTLDDTIATREVRQGRSFPSAANQRSDGGALTQALGTKVGTSLHPTIQRFILDEDGILLLCSDGLSDGDWLEREWSNFSPQLLSGNLSLETAVKQFIDRANECNGEDNVSVVLCHNFVAAPQVELFSPQERDRTAEEMSASSQSLFATATPRASRRRPPISPAVALVSLAVAVVVSTSVGIWIWSQVAPGSFQQFQEQISPSQ